MSRIKISYLLAAVLMLSACGDEPEEKKETPKEETPVDTYVPKVISYQLINQYPHSTTAFTEGLEYVDGYLYEGTGQYGRSDIRKTELTTGKVIKDLKVSDQYFGEGITVMGDKIYQLTYREKKAMVYDKNTFKLLQTFPTFTNEAWGMTNDGTNIIYGDGSDQLYFVKPEDFSIIKTLKVNDRFGPVSYINELEYINGFIYANQWQTDLILKIDPNSGKVVAHADLTTLRARTGIPAPGMDENAPEVMNGIAYDKENNRIFITGKNWPKLFEIKLDN